MGILFRNRFVNFTTIVILAFMAVVSAAPARASLSIDTSNPANWVISNGVLTLGWDSQNGHLYHVYYHGVNMVDTKSINMGLYMDNTGSMGGGASSSGYHQDGSSYIDWWITNPAGPDRAFTFTQHFILTNNNSGLSVYCVADHTAADPAGGLGQIQYVFRISQPLFDHTYSISPDLSNTGVIVTPLPQIPGSYYADKGRQVQNAVLDIHGLALPSGYFRQYETKYDYSGYEYLHHEQGVYGTQYAAWTFIPSTESLVGGPTKQDLFFTGNILMMEIQSNHLDNELGCNAEQGIAFHRLYGPFYFHFNQFTPSVDTPKALSREAWRAGKAMEGVYGHDSVLLQNGYILPRGRGSVKPIIANGGSPKPNTAWVVLSDNQTNFQLSSHGYQYWASEDAKGTTPLTGVVPGIYRLSEYVLGKWGELRRDNVVVSSAKTTALPDLKFVPENFSTTAPVWTIGTPDRSAHEFLHGHFSNGQDDREYQGTWNYWKDFEGNKGAVNYNATDGPGYTATNNLDKWNYVQWTTFDPGEYAGIYNPSDDTRDGYKYICPSYVGDPATTKCPPWQVHFTTTAKQLAQGQYAVLSVALASAEGPLDIALNGHTLRWVTTDYSDAMVRSGLSGFTEWAALQWPTADLAPDGQDNVLTFRCEKFADMYDALRFEITDKSADPSVTGWNDYAFVSDNIVIPVNDSLENP